MFNDAVADMLTRVRNAGAVKHHFVYIPLTKVTKSIAEFLLKEKFIGSVEELKHEKKPSLLVGLKYSGKEKVPRIQTIERVSKPGLRVYVKGRKVPRVLGGFGIAIVSTSSGLMSDVEARQKNIGGEILCYIT